MGVDSETKETSEKVKENANMNIDNYIERFITSVEKANRATSKKPFKTTTKRKKTKEILKHLR